MNRRSVQILVVVGSLFAVVVLSLTGAYYWGARRDFDQALHQEAVAHHASFRVAVTMTLANMHQLVAFIAEDPVLNNLFIAGKDAVLREGGGAGGAEAQFIRESMLRVIKPRWDRMTDTHGVRQLHYHLGPGSLSFLRVHQPDQYGDNLDDIRHIIVDSNEDRRSRVGFETGRVNSGLRAVEPVYARSLRTGVREFVGVVEAGTSFDSLLARLDAQLGAGFTVALNSAHVERNMWPEFLQQRIGPKLGDCACYVEATSRDIAPDLVRGLDRDMASLLNNTFRVSSGEKHFAVSTFPLHDYRSMRDGLTEPVGAVIITSDVTSRVHSFRTDQFNIVVIAMIGLLLTESVLIAGFLFAQKRLDMIIERRTAELKDEIKQKDRFFSLIAHDLKGPFNALLGFADLLADNARDLPRDDIASYAEVIRDSGKRFYNLLENLLHWSRARMNKLTLSFVRLPVRNTAEEAAQAYSDIAQNKDITLRIDGDTGISVRADHGALSTILRNLISNALKFTKIGGEVRVSVSQADDSVRIAVIDSGVGMSEDQMAALFSLDQSQSATGTAGETGTGLGLILSHELALRMNGSLSVRSEKDRGSEFILELPVWKTH